MCEVKIIYKILDEELSGLCFLKDKAPYVAINVLHSMNRQRFTVPHEIGHVILHAGILNKGVHLDKTITMLRRDVELASGKVAIEVRANQFAAALLMPKSLIAQYMDENGLQYGVSADEDTIEAMAKAFKVSSTAMAIRIGNLNVR